ncbi:SHOCT domain-containing protein [Streptomyces tateyamensis]|uniref:SHOCT domain-containing protein n=1 Tax=Streptomyces tateyamensis TaxID=565073 RepID=A0A2V4PNV3_9ACTN|nr:SHOCT domain-containing protein [Streptomyces tateyamensis]PYC85828.1 SHOCT domain-containing protein [Streptomyces tateyamensis]
MFRPMRPIRPVRVVRPVGAPLVRGLVVGGAAYAAGRGAARSAADEQAQDQAIADLRAQQQARPVPPAAAASPGVADMADQLTRLGTMVQQGLLTPGEFQQAKAKLLG